ncbi:hypothetical protein EX30DRAFT_65548 [Ascodesmis nigricans]|uniref:Secreted protein n=1 Tax=Ascodesmis nigricans TaxID=341454 RepID=A0A4S2MUM8_9PEZI|nr:hypothetical protein EX30DRAFT_65548 [Ascodesmis nigricans]
MDTCRTMPLTALGPLSLSVIVTCFSSSFHETVIYTMHVQALGESRSSGHLRSMGVYTGTWDQWDGRLGFVSTIPKVVLTRFDTRIACTALQCQQKAQWQCIVSNHRHRYLSLVSFWLNWVEVRAPL